jgi:hypothetical protein
MEQDGSESQIKWRAALFAAAAIEKVHKKSACML